MRFDVGWCSPEWKNLESFGRHGHWTAESHPSSTLDAFFGLGLEVVWYFVFPKIQDREFREGEATHPDVVPSSGWKALGWGFAGLADFFAIAIVTGILLNATGIAPQ